MIALYTLPVVLLLSGLFTLAWTYVRWYRLSWRGRAWVRVVTTIISFLVGVSAIIWSIALASAAVYINQS